MASAFRARSALEGLDGVKRVIPDDRRHEVLVLFEDQETNEQVFVDKLKEAGFVDTEIKSTQN